VLFAGGLVMVYSSSAIFAEDRFKGDSLHFVKRHLTFMVLGAAAFFGARRLPLERLRGATVGLLAAAIATLAGALIPGISHRAGGASRWLAVGGLTFQPAELAKVAVILYVALQLARKGERQDNWRAGLLAYFLGALPVYALLLAQPDFGTVALLACVTLCMMLACGARARYVLAAIAGVIPVGAALILTSPYRKARLLGFLDPWSDPGHKGFQVIQSFLAFFSGKWFGVGVGNSHEKLFYLPEAHNDFIFAVIGEEFGFIGVAIVVSLYLIIVMRGLSTARRLTDPFQRALAVGISSLIGLQAFFNMGVVLGLLPTKGLPLPLVSYGGTSLLATMFMLGLLAQLTERAR
jgi:cell division protein FtsW